MDEDLKWLIGLATTMLAVWISTFAAAVWKILAKISRADDDRKAGDDVLHERVNKVREDTAHRSDMHELGTRLSKDLKSMEKQQIDMNNATNLRLDALLAAIANRNDHRRDDK